MKKLGIVPAGGLGSRWGKYPKFLLPCGDREWVLDRTIRTFPTKDICVLYSADNLGEITQHLHRCGLLAKGIVFVESKTTLLESMLAAMEHDADYYYFAMPDTYFPKDTFHRMRHHDFSLGVFLTDMPERFGVIRNGKIVDKEQGVPGLAWGTLGWSRAVRDLWLKSNLVDHTDAFNIAIDEFGYVQNTMEFYKDFATWQDYAEFIIWLQEKNG